MAAEERAVAGLLATVPEEHLVSGEEVCRTEGTVAFGSDAWEVFSCLDRADGKGLPVVIYASQSRANLGPTISWTATYVGHVHSRNGAHPRGEVLRPPTTSSAHDGRCESWGVYWEVEDLHSLPPEKCYPISRLSDRRGQTYKAFIPRGPVLLGGLG